MSQFGDRIKKLRNEKKKESSIWTQEYVANKIGVARVTYTAYENGTKQPPMETISIIASVFGTNTDYLINGKEEIYIEETPIDKLKKSISKKIQNMTNVDDLSKVDDHVDYVKSKNK